MHAAVIVVALGVPALVVVLIVLLVTARGGRPHGHDATVVAARRHETRTSAAAAASSVCAALAVANPTVVSWGPSGLLVGLAPLVAALMFGVARTVGESRWPRPAGEVRTALLVRRSLRDQGGWRLPVLLGTAAVLGVALVVFGITAADDGRSVERTAARVGDAGLEAHSAGTYPGWVLGGPALVVLLLAVLAALIALRAITRRPPIGLLSVAQDDAIRRTSAARLLAGAQAWTGLAATGYLALAAGALLSAGWAEAGVTCIAVAVVVFVGSLVIAAAALTPRRGHAEVTAPQAVPSGPAA